jgi:dTDP-glucose 4,6-dehydratase
MTALIAGGAGFVGTNLVLDLQASRAGLIINLDKLINASNPETLTNLQGYARHQLLQGDIGDAKLGCCHLAEQKPRPAANTMQSKSAK